MEQQDILTILAGFGLPEKECLDLLGISNLKDLQAGGHYLSAGQIPQKFGIVLRGLFRYYYLDDRGGEFTKGFIEKNSVLISYSAMLHNEPSHFFIQALEPSLILEVNYKNWLALQEGSRHWDKFQIRALEKGYCTKEKRERELLLLDAETRYRNFLEEFPGLEKRVTQQMVASYLGIKPESLSRIRKNFRS